MIRPEEVYKIGRIGKPHGVKGELKMQVSDDIFDRTDAEYLVLDIEGILVPFFIEEYRFQSDSTAIVKFCDVNSQEKASELTGADVFFPRKLADADADNPSVAAIIGFKLIDAATGHIVGTITGLDDSTINLLFEIETEQGEVLVPASDNLIEDIDTAGQTVTMNIPEGLLSLDS